MRGETVGQAAVTRLVGMEPIGGEERLAARAEHLVDGAARADVRRARGWVGGSTLAALIRSTPQAEHRLQRGRNSRYHRQIDEPADDRLDPGPIERTDHGAEITFELHERRRVDGIVRADRHHRDVGASVEDRRKLVHQHVGNARATHGVSGQMDSFTQARRGLSHEHVSRRVKPRTGQGAIAECGDPGRKAAPRTRHERAAVVPGEVLVVEQRQR